MIRRKVAYGINSQSGSNFGPTLSQSELPAIKNTQRYKVSFHRNAYGVCQWRTGVMCPKNRGIRFVGMQIHRHTNTQQEPNMCTEFAWVGTHLCVCEFKLNPRPALHAALVLSLASNFKPSTLPHHVIRKVECALYSCKKLVWSHVVSVRVISKQEMNEHKQKADRCAAIFITEVKCFFVLTVHSVLCQQDPNPSV